VAIRRGLPAKLALTDADDTRYLFSGLVVCNVDGSPRGGVLSPVGVNLVTSSATMNVSVARFQGAAVRDGGIILLANDGAANVLLDAAPGANSRIDVIYAKQNDASGTVTVPDANNTALLTFVKGTAGAVPVKPTLPVGALELATVLIPSGATATNSAGVVITQTAQFAAASGGVVPFRTKAALDLWTTPSTTQRATVLADGIEYRRLGGAWKAWDSDWITYTPTLTNITLGSGSSVVGKYRYQGTEVQRSLEIILGTGGSVGTNPTVSFPVAPETASPSNRMYPGSIKFQDVSTLAVLDGTAILLGGVLRLLYMGGSPSAGTGITSTAPFTWTTGDFIMIRDQYMAAA
jgi:hypothetical protein